MTKRKVSLPIQIIEAKIKKMDRYRHIAYLIIVILMLAVGYHQLDSRYGMMQVENEEMRPNMGYGDIVIYDKKSGYQKDDIVCYEMDGKHHIGRIVAVGRAQVDVGSEQELLIDGQREDGTIDHTAYLFDTTTAFPLDIEKDEYLILEDHRLNARYDRSRGIIKKEQIEGRVMRIWRKNDGW